MARQIINAGRKINDGTGDSLRLGAQKINANFDELYTAILLSKVSSLTATNGISLVDTNSAVASSGDLTLSISNAFTIPGTLTAGSDLRTAGKLYVKPLDGAGAVLSGSSILPGLPTDPAADVTQQYDIGSYSRRFRTLYSDVQGNITGTLTPATPFKVTSHTTTERNQLTVEPGTILFNNSVKKLQLYTGLLWIDVVAEQGSVNASSLVGTVLSNSVVTSSLTSVGTLTNLTVTNTIIGTASAVINGVYTTDTATVTNAMLAGSIANTKLATSTISGVPLGNNLLTLSFGSGFAGGTYNGSADVTLSLGAAYGDTVNPYGNKPGNYILAAPNGSTGAPVFRSLVAADVPTLNQSTSGNAATATKFAATHNINGVAFDGSTDITVPAAAGTLTGTTIASNVVVSSLTSLGTLTTALIGTNTAANSTRFPNALLVSSNTVSGIQQNETANAGIIGEGTAGAGTSNIWGVGVYGVAYTSNTSGASATAAGVVGQAHVSATGDTLSAVGVRGYSNDTHASGSNIGLYGAATGSSIGNYALYMNVGDIFANSSQTWYMNGALTFSGAYNVTIPQPVVTNAVALSAAPPTIASGSTIAPTKAVTFISGIATIATITPPANFASTGGQLTLIPTGLWITNTAGNVALATTAVVGKAVIMTYDSGTSKWYPSY